MNRRPHCGQVLLVLLAAACSRAGDRDERYRPRPPAKPEMDASVHRDPDPPPPILASHPTASGCSAPIVECRPEADEVWKVLLDASEFGADARFVTSDGVHVMVDLGEGDFRIAPLQKQYVEGQREQKWVLEEFQVSNQHPIDMKNHQVLTCDDAREHCSLWRETGQPPAAWRALELPRGFAPRGIVSDRISYWSETSCVFGSGMLCWAEDAGQWQEEISGSGGLMLNAVASDSRPSLAAGDHGRWFMESDTDGGSAWQEQPSLGDATLTQIGTTFLHGVVIGDGRIQVVVDRGTPAFACEPPVADLRALFLDFGQRAYAVTNDGDIVRHLASTPDQPETYCAMQHLALTVPVLEAFWFPCEFGRNPRILTERQLIGHVDVCDID